MNNSKTPPQARREFLSKFMATGMISCFGINSLLAQSNQEDNFPPQKDEKHKFLCDSEMSYQAVFNFAYKSNFIPFMKNLSEEIGKEEFIELLRKASTKRGTSSGKNWLKNATSNDFNSFKESLERVSQTNFMKHIVTFEITKDTKNTIQMNCTECLWAKTFREAKAGEIGFACFCNQDFAVAQAFNPKIKLSHKTKSLMEGGTECILCWEYEA